MSEEEEEEEEDEEEFPYGVREWYQEKRGIYVHFTWLGVTARSPGQGEDCASVDLGGGKPLCARETIRHPGNACWRRASISIIFSYAFLFLPCHLVPPPFTFTVVCPVHAS